MINRIGAAWLGLAALLLLGALPDARLTRPRGLPDLFLGAQDLPILIGIVALALAALAARLIPGVGARLGQALEALAATPSLAIIRSPRRPLAAALILAAMCGGVAYAGAWLIMEGYPLSMDEYMATFDSVILGHGAPMAPVAAAWRPYVVALEPQFVFHTVGAGYWVSAYLPVNAALRALVRWVGDANLTSPILAAVSVIAVFAIGRRMWPERPRIALAASLLLATSSQFLFMAMTPYAMTAHLAFNLVWLWLFLRGGRLGHAGALAVGFLACGLHQFVFHPLFVAPFVLQLWLERRWRAAALYTLAYAGICLFWISYGSLVLRALGTAPPTAGEVGAGHVTSQVVALVSGFDLAGVGRMAKNLIRFVTWQNPLTAPLAVLGTVAAVKAKGTVRSLILGVVLTLAAVFVLMPYQGHGWGYRYLHGLLGSTCLLAAWTWGRLSDRLDARVRSASRLVFVGVAAASLLALFPIRAWQANGLLHPYAAADRAIRHTASQIVLVDDRGVWFGMDLVRNDPYLRNRPIVLRLRSLGRSEVSALCARHTASIFDRDDARRFGIRTAPGRRPRLPMGARPDEAGAWMCGDPPAPVRHVALN
jgi:hypothetical protein